MVQASEAIGREICAIAVGCSAAQAGELRQGGDRRLSGEQEHGVAMLTTLFGNVMRDAAGGGKAWISSFTKRAAPGSHRYSARTQGRALCAVAL